MICALDSAVAMPVDVAGYRWIEGVSRILFPEMGPVIYLSSLEGLRAINPKLTRSAVQADVAEEAGSLQLPI